MADAKPPRPNPLPVAGPQRASAAAQSKPANIDPNAPLEDQVIALLRTIRDPEIPASIYDLGLIYGIDVGDEGHVHVRMTLTTPACPVAQSLPGQVEAKLCTLERVRSAKVEIVWDPPWTKDKMSDAVKLALGLL